MFDAIITGIVFVMPFSDCSLIMYRNAIVFCVLTLYHAALLNSFIMSNNLFVVSRIFFIKDYIICIQRQFYFFLSNWMTFISISCLIALVRTSSIWLTAVVKVGILFFLIQMKSFQSFTIEYYICCRLFINSFYNVEVVSFCSYFVECFYNERVFNFVKCFLCIN